MLNFQLRLSGRQREALYRRLSDTRQRGDHRIETRVLTMLGLADGYGIDEVKLFQVSGQTVRNWLQKLFTGGVDELVRMKRSPGRPAKLSKAQRRELGRLLDAGPEAAGFTGGCWRSPMIQVLIEQRFGVLYSVHYLSELLHSIGFSYQKAGFESDHLNEKARAEWLEAKWPAILALAEQKNAHILFGDEASFPQWGTLSYTWARRGCQPVAKTSGKRKGYKVWGLIDYFTGRFFYQCQEGRLNSESYKVFLRCVLSQTRKHVILIQDGARYHTSAATKAFFEQRANRLTVYQLPSYSPDFNPIEKLWKKVKEYGTHLHYFPTFEAAQGQSRTSAVGFQGCTKRSALAVRKA